MADRGFRRSCAAIRSEPSKTSSTAHQNTPHDLGVDASIRQIQPESQPRGKRQIQPRCKPKSEVSNLDGQNEFSGISKK
jgi:hypothetical protein